VPPGCPASPPHRGRQPDDLGSVRRWAAAPGMAQPRCRGRETQDASLLDVGFADKNSKYFLLFAPVYGLESGHGEQRWRNKAAPCSRGCLGSRGSAQSFWVWVAAPERHSERDDGRHLASCLGRSAALRSMTEPLGQRRPSCHMQGGGSEIISPSREKNCHFPVPAGQRERGSRHFSPLPAALAQTQLPASSRPARSLFPSPPLQTQAKVCPGCVRPRPGFHPKKIITRS